MERRGFTSSIPVPVPDVIAIRTDELAPLLREWRKRHPFDKWKCLLRAALLRELEPLAGKRHAYLVNGSGPAGRLKRRKAA